MLLEGDVRWEAAGRGGDAPDLDVPTSSRRCQRASSEERAINDAWLDGGMARSRTRMQTLRVRCTSDG
jgi:hypothetical protein